MNAQLVKNVEERGYRGRRERYYLHGRVVTVDKVTATCVVDVGFMDRNGNPRYLVGVPYQMQSPPKLNDTIALNYLNSSPHSLTVGGSAPGGTTTGEPDGPTYVHKFDRPKIKDDITLTQSGSLVITQTGQNIDFYVPPVTPPVNEGTIRLIPKTGDVRRRGGAGVTIKELQSVNGALSSIVYAFPGGAGDHNEIQWIVPLPDNVALTPNVRITVHIIGG